MPHGACPVGVATQNPWLTRGLDPTLKSVRLANYVMALRHELFALSRARGVTHPALVPLERIEILDGRFGSASAAEVFRYEPGWGLPSLRDQEETHALMLGLNAPSAALTPPPSAPVSLGMPSFRDTTDPKTPPLE